MHYHHLLIMAVLSFISMDVLMQRWSNVSTTCSPNVNLVYMAGLMTAPMVIIEVTVMWANRDSI